jgi:hypothetical protein
MQTSKSPQEYDQRIKDDPLALAVKSIVDVMRNDYGERFTRAFADREQVRQLKRRLYAKLVAVDPRDIYDGYDELTEKNPGFIPTVPEIVEAAHDAQKARFKREREQADVERVAALPPPTVLADPKRVFNLMREALGKAKTHDTAEEREARLLRIKQKQTELAAHFNPGGHTPPVLTKHQCAVAWCDAAGTFSVSKVGGEIWYCRDHAGR